VLIVLIDRRSNYFTAITQAIVINWHSLIGAVGIGIKYSVESVFGVIYPRHFRDDTGQPPVDTAGILDRFNQIDRLNRPSSNQDSGYGTQNTLSQGQENIDPNQGQGDTSNTISEAAEEPPAKKARAFTSKTKEEAKKTTGGGGATEPSETVIHKPISEFKTGKIVINHTRFMYSYGYQFKTLTSKFKTESDGTQLLVCPPFARVPCHGLPFYMTKTEFENLPIGSQGAIFMCSIQPLGFRTPFVTNSANISSVNSNLLVHGVHAHGLNNKYNGKNMEYTSTSSSPMIITEAKIRKDDGVAYQDFWGTQFKAGDTNINFDNIPACFGNKKPF
jgi:hypothetical protein